MRRLHVNREAIGGKLTLFTTTRWIAKTMIWAVLMALPSKAAEQLGAQDNSAEAVLSGCKAFVEDRANGTESMMLASFCSGVVYALGAAGQYVSMPEWRSCVPAGSTARELARVVLKYIETRPERTHEDFRRLTLEALHDAWPCSD
jgi:hypothetical protein